MTIKLTEKQQLMFDIYMFIFDQFAADTGDIEKKFNLTNSKARSLCKSIEKKQLIDGEIVKHVGGCRVSGGSINSRSCVGSSIVWQCVETYDSIGAKEAEELFFEKIKKY